MGLKDKLQQIDIKNQETFAKIKTDLLSVVTEAWFTGYIIKQFEFGNYSTLLKEITVFFEIDKSDKDDDKKPIKYSLGLHAENIHGKLYKMGKMEYSVLTKSGIQNEVITKFISEILQAKIEAMSDIEKVSVEYFPVGVHLYYNPTFKITFKNPIV